MHKPAVDSCFDIAFWLLDRALDEGEYLQPQKLHRLMYLTQAYFASARHGAKLMPAVFVIGSDGPFEPNMYRAMERGRPMVDTAIPDPEAVHVLDNVWRQYGAKSIEWLNASVKNHPPVAEARENGEGSEISFDAMVEFYVKTLGQQSRIRSDAPSNADVPSPDQVLRPKIMRSHTGKPVAVNRWSPRRVDK
jgi:uncharacterized phage-associated protein